MKNPNFNIGIVLGVLFMAAILVFNSCKKDKNDYPSPSPTDQWNNSAMTNASFMGQILKEDGSPLDGAIVSTGTHSFTTDADGFFYFSDINTPSKATVLKVEKTGYFKAVKTIQVIANQDNQTRIMIMELPVAKTFNASLASTIIIDNGGSIDFPANAIVDAVTNQPYTGNVNVYAKWIDPSGSNLDLLTPGALRGISAEGGEEGLTTYGMQAVELVGSAGQSLQLGNGQSAQVTFPVPSSLSGVAPATVPLWHFDEAKGMWVEEGAATKTGTNYVGSVSHFSFWNCDYGGAIVNFTCQLVDASNNPLVGATVRIVPISLNLTPRSVITNSNGTVLGGLPVNATFNLEYIPAGCPWNSAATFIQSFSSTVSNINLGTITVPTTSSNPATVIGVVQDCSNAILPNAPVKLIAGGALLNTVSDASGAFSFTLNCLSGPTPAVVTAYDVSNSVNGSSNINVVPNTTANAGKVQACETLNGFINWSSNDEVTTTNSSIVEMANGAVFSQFFQTNTYINAQDSTLTGSQYINFSFDGPQTTAGTHYLITCSDHLGTGTSIVSGSPIVNLTNYQAIGGWIEGSYTATLTSPSIPSRVVNCNFRVQRQQ